MWPLTYYASHTGYYTVGLTRPQWKDLGTALCLLGFAVPYWLVKRR